MRAIELLQLYGLKNRLSIYSDPLFRIRAFTLGASHHPGLTIDHGRFGAKPLATSQRTRMPFAKRVVRSFELEKSVESYEDCNWRVSSTSSANLPRLDMNQHNRLDRALCYYTLLAARSFPSYPEVRQNSVVQSP